MASRPRRLVRIGLFLLAASALDAVSASTRRVLVLHSFGRGFEPTESVSSAFRTAITAEAADPIEFHEISVEMASFSGTDSETPFVDYLRAFDAQFRPDLVVAIGGPAARFAQRNRERVFAGTPVLLAGVEFRLVKRQALGEHDAEVTVRIDLTGAFENVFRLLPETKTVAVVIGGTALEGFWSEEIRKGFEPFKDRAALVLYNDLPFDEMLKRAASLPRGSAIFYALYLQDVKGVPRRDDDALLALHDAASAPVFGLFDTQLGRGIVGGPLISIRDVGARIASAAVRLLSGESPSAVRFEPIGAGEPQYDWNELARWKIDEARLPPASVIRSRPPSFWAANRWTIAWIAAVGGAEAALILVLLAALAGRRRAEEAMRDMSGRLLVAQEEERARLARELHDDVTQRLARLAIDAGRIEREHAGTRVGGTMREVREELARLSEDIHALSYRLHPSLVEDLGLPEALQVECERFTKLTAVPAELELGRLPESTPHVVAICLYRVAQEALRNVHRHASARSVTVFLGEADGGLGLTVRDDGVGFEPAAEESRRSLGHASMRERVHLVGGKVDIRSAPGRGTTITAWVPLREERR